ncbi:MAG: hypothetical protein IPM48_14435 [Saprospiraceae bacterium]|nr:hypothetical protein [Saprospiraceae bacterium]
MKLYATTTSERASKGQGGNERLLIEILVYDRCNPLYTIEVTPEKLIFRERGYSEPLLERNHKDIKKQEELKGKRQKGEHVCEVLGCKNITETPYAYCTEHIYKMLGK